MKQGRTIVVVQVEPSYWRWRAWDIWAKLFAPHVRKSLVQGMLWAAVDHN